MVYKSLIRRWQGAWASAWLYTYEKHTGKWGALCSKNWLDLDGGGSSISPVSKTINARVSKIKKIKKIVKIIGPVMNGCQKDKPRM